MKSPHPFLIALLLTSALFAGCLGGDDEPIDPQDEAASEEGLATLTGTILTIHLNPVQNAQVRLVQGNDIAAETTTTQDGKYTIRNVEPGDYRLQVSAACCRENVRAVTLVADQVTNADLQLNIFTSDDLQQPRIEQYQWTGFLVCSVASPVILVSACSAIDIVMDDILEQGNVTDDEFIHPFTVGRGLKSIVAAMEWRAPGAALGDELSVIVERYNEPNQDPVYGQARGHSPLQFRMDAGGVESAYGSDLHKYDFNNVEDSLDLWFRVFAWGNANLVYQQQFTIYYDLYYWDSAPESATALPDL